ncbi:hypothetical protein Tco_1488573, partial [Tanacetum coccineum]
MIPIGEQTPPRLSESLCESNEPLTEDNSKIQGSIHCNDLLDTMQTSDRLTKTVLGFYNL